MGSLRSGTVMLTPVFFWTRLLTTAAWFVARAALNNPINRSLIKRNLPSELPRRQFTNSNCSVRICKAASLEAYSLVMEAAIKQGAVSVEEYLSGERVSEVR